jgi:hypothetical protein
MNTWVQTVSYSASEAAWADVLKQKAKEKSGET